MAGNELLLQVLRVPYEVPSEIHGAVTLDTKRVQFVLDGCRYNKHTKSIWPRNSFRKNQIRISRWCFTEQHRQRTNAALVLTEIST